MAWFYRLLGLGFMIAWFVVAPTETLSRWEVFAVKVIVIVTLAALAEVIDVGKR